VSGEGVTLTEAEWESITTLLATERMRNLWHQCGEYCDEDCAQSGSLRDAFNSILTARLAAVEADREYEEDRANENATLVHQARAERDAAQEHIAYHLRDFRPTADMAATGDLAVDMVAYADRLKVRGEAAEQQLADLRASITALADDPAAQSWDDVLLTYVRTDRLRALLDDPAPSLDAARAQAKAEERERIARAIEDAVGYRGPNSQTDYGRGYNAGHQDRAVMDVRIARADLRATGETDAARRLADGLRGERS
jgi:signal transduction histidine kinase